MKKKIINGMLMAAFLFAGTTSFVSCKDNIDDELVPVHQDLATLDNKIKELEGTVAGHTTDIQNLRTDLTKLQNRVAANKVSIDSLALITKALDKKIDSIANVVANLTVGVTIQGTVDPVLGEVRGYLTDKNTLLGFIGKNDTEIDIFPVAGDDYNVKGFETKLTAEEADIDEALDLSGEKGEWLMAENTFGRVYVSLNPMGADATKCSFYLVPTGASFNTATGQFTETSPVKFTDAYPSTKNLTLAFGKKFGMDWEDFLNANEWDPESGLFPVTWGLDALVDSTSFEGMQFKWDSFRSDYVNGWKMADLIATIKEIWHNMQDGTKSRTERGAETLVSAQGVMKAIADALEYKRGELTQYAVGTVVNATKRGLVSEAKITNVAIEPLGYMAAVNFDAVSDSYKWNFGAAKNLASKIYEKIAAKFPNFTSVNLLQNAGGNITANVTTTAGAGTATIKIDDVINALQLQQVQDMINDALKFYNRIKNGNAGNLVQRAENYMNRVTEQILDKYGDVATISVMPLVMMETTEGFKKLVDGMPVNTEAGDFKMVLTSLTGEYIVPVFAKYVALEVDGEIVWHKAVPGAQKKFEFELPEGKSTLLVQCVDYTGRVITQKYPFNAKAAE
jgi:hypothetical protein